MDFTIGFNLLKNEPPRSTYLGPGESDIHFVRIFYEWHFFEEDRGYYYYNLSRHIIDPDGSSDPIDGRPDVRVRQFVNLRPDNLPTASEEIRRRATGISEWREELTTAWPSGRPIFSRWWPETTFRIRGFASESNVSTL